MKDLNSPNTWMYLDRVVVLQKSVDFADRGTVHITGEEQRPRLNDDERKKKNNSQAKLVCEETKTSALWVQGIFLLEEQGTKFVYKTDNKTLWVLLIAAKEKQSRYFKKTLKNTLGLSKKGDFGV